MVYITCLIIYVLDSISLSDLRIICCVNNGTNSIQCLGIACQYCTAISSFSGNSQTTKNAINTLRGKLPYLKVYDHERNMHMISHVHNLRKMNLFIGKLELMINDEKIDAMAFDNFESVLPNRINMDHQYELCNFFIMLKVKFPNVLFGLLISKKKIDYAPSVLNDAVQFYIVKSISYKKCIRKSHQKDMANTSPVESMEDTLKLLKKNEFDLSKVILTIRIVVNNVMKLRASGKDDATYTYHCSTDLPNKWAKYCSETSEGFYAKDYNGLTPKELQISIVKNSFRKT